jgi:hypothetical protein
MPYVIEKTFDFFICVDFRTDFYDFFCDFLFKKSFFLKLLSYFFVFATVMPGARYKFYAITESSFCPKGTPTYEVVEDRKEDGRSEEETQKETQTINVIKRENHRLNMKCYLSVFSLNVIVVLILVDP